jgi:hypothetical protein
VAASGHGTVKPGLDYGGESTGGNVKNKTKNDVVAQQPVGHWQTKSHLILRNVVTPGVHL